MTTIPKGSKEPNSVFTYGLDLSEKAATNIYRALLKLGILSILCILYTVF